MKLISDEDQPPKVRIDNEPPLLPLNQYFKTNNYNGDASALAGLEEQNRKLIQRINVMYRTKGKVDNEGFVGLYSSTWDLRKSLAILTERQNKQLYNKILQVKSIYDRKFMQEDYVRKRKVYDDAKLNQGIEKKLVVDKIKDWSIIPANSPVEPDPCKRVRCWMDLEGRHERKPERTELDRLIIEVYLDMAPRSGENFVKMCRGDIFGFSYECTKIYKVYPGMFCVGGDVLKGNGVSGRSIFTVPFPNERAILEFNGPGVVGTYSEGDQGYTTSQFIISLSAVPSLKKHSVAFGRVVSGFKTLDRLSDLSKKSGNPFVNVIITKCGVVCADQEKLPYQPDFEIPDDIRDHYNKKEEEQEMDARMRMMFLEQTRFYKQHGYMVKVNPDKRYPPLPWVEQTEDASLHEDSGRSGMAFIAEAEARNQQAQGLVSVAEETSPPPPAPTPPTTPTVTQVEIYSGDADIIRINTASELASKSKELVRQPPARKRSSVDKDKKTSDEKKKAMTDKDRKGGGGVKGGRKGVPTKKEGEQELDGHETEETIREEQSKAQEDPRKKKKGKKVKSKLKEKEKKMDVQKAKVTSKSTETESLKKYKYTGQGFSLRYPIKYLDDKDYQKCMKRCKGTVFCS